MRTSDLMPAYVLACIVLMMLATLYERHLPAWGRWTLGLIAAPVLIVVVAHAAAVFFGLVRRWCGYAGRVRR